MVVLGIKLLGALGELWSQKRPSGACLCEGLIEICHDVVDILDANRQTNQFGCDPACGLLFLVELGMGCGRRVDSKGLRVPDIGKMRVQLKRLDKGLSCICPTFDAEDHHGAALTSDVFLILRVLWAVLEPGVADPLHGLMILQVSCDGESIVTVALHPEGQGFDSL